MAESMELVAPATLFRSRLHPSSQLQFISGLCKHAPDKRLYISMLSSDNHQVPFQRSYKYQLLEHNNRRILSPPSATSSGFEASMLEAEDSKLRFKTVDIVVESSDASEIQLRVDLPGEETQRAFDVILTNLARSAPPIPGFRRQKGGKTAQVPKGLLLNMIGEARVTKFTIQEIITSVLIDYENLAVKDKKISTIQTEAELKISFSPGNAFGFNAVLELEET
ncbi:hypothetical protein V2J09_014840 [Rumex salicifolius]